MPSVKVRESDSFENALRKFKSSVSVKEFSRK